MIYTEKIKKLNNEHIIESKASQKISMLRLLVFSLIAGSFFLIFHLEKAYIGMSLFLPLTLLFIYLIKKHENVLQRKQKIELLLIVNKVSEKRKNNNWIDFEDTGEEFLDRDHPYANDLDIFGKASLFQWINSTNTMAGRKLLSEKLTNPYRDISQIVETQESIKELSSKIDWRQNLQAEGLKLEKEKWVKESIKHIIEDDKEYIKNKSLKYSFRTLPLVFFSLILLYYPFNLIPAYIPSAIFIFQVIISLLYQRKISKNFSLIARYKNIIKLYSALLKCIEEEQFNSSELIKLQKNLTNRKNRAASLQIKRLETIVDLINLRHSSIHPVINFLTLWDIQCLISFDKWKLESGIMLEKWINTIAEFEALSSLSIIMFDNKEWAMPSFSDKKEDYLIDAKKLGHPLLNKNNRVYNNFHSNKKGSIAIITGSNMSGKSTFLRTVAINLLLAYLGTPVCGVFFRCSLMKIFTSMRISDNLDKNISSFYAELLRIKIILDASVKKEKILFILDEIFRGTNSRDRIMGAKEVLKKLSKENATGFVSTHDMELTDLENNKNLNIKNYHFRENYMDNKIFFNYKLLENISTTTDAIYLMKMVGIEIENEEGKEKI